MRATTLLDVFSQLEDPRSPRGVRHPFSGIVVLMLLGMLARIREMEVLVRWARVHWDQLKEPLGFDRDQPPCATTISRTLAGCQIGNFQAALDRWLQDCLAQASTTGVLAVDGKTAKQGIDSDGHPLHMLNAFVHDLQVVIGQWSTGAEKTNESTLLRQHLEQLLDTYPMLRLFTGDAFFAQRPLVELMTARGCDYLLQVKANQQETLDALEHCFAKATERTPTAETTEKRGLSRKPVVFGSIWTLRLVAWQARLQATAEYIREVLDLTGCQIALRVDRELRTADGEVVLADVRYFVTSLHPEQTAAAQLLRHVRGHWQIENNLHFVKDRWWDEDRHHTRRPGLSACLAAINNAALSIHRLRSDPELPVRAAADYIAWKPAIGTQLLHS